MSIYELAALGAAVTWAFAGIVSAGPSQALGALAFVRFRMIIVFFMLGAWTTYAGTWSTIDPNAFTPLLLSGFIGIFLGDTALFLTMNRLGPRRTAILFAMNAPISVMLGYLFLAETLPPLTLIGIAITFVGVVLAIIYGKRKTQLHDWESIKGPLWTGLMFGFVAALCQSVGAIIVRPIMETGADAIAVSALRIGIAAIALIAASFYPSPHVKAKTKLDINLLGRVALSGTLGMAVGMTLLIFALKGGEVGIITTLSATTPAMILPLLWWRTKEMPAAGAWVGAALVIAGTALIFNS